ncbi:hypothetical protein [Paenibacillus elgii]|uniref:hypothetical protein n=1 Tax=Paenibacillus elgii TaxID=189691 RepID=UPI001EF89301|nr:hypothetical protein [Paenibacillus elgii]
MTRTVEPGDRERASFDETGFDMGTRTSFGRRNAKRRIGFAAFLQQLYCRFQDDEVPALGAQLTYYLILAFFRFSFSLLLSLASPILRQQKLSTAWPE